jgi:hypothetical protein
MEDRRAFLRLAAFGLASTALGAGAAHAATPAVPSGAAPSWLLSPLTVGSDIGLGWRLASVAPPSQGAITVALGHADGRAARVDLSLREGAPKGPAASRYVDFIVMDGADGDAPMAEDLGRALRRLAAIVADNESGDLDTLARLEPHADRVWRHADALTRDFGGRRDPVDAPSATDEAQG